MENGMGMEVKIRLYDDKTVGQEDGMTGGREDVMTVGGEMETELTGICNPYYKLRKESSYVKGMITGDFNSASVMSLEEKKLSELTSEYIISWNLEPGTRSDSGFCFLELPRFKTGFDSWNLVQYTVEGNTPVRLDYPLEEEYSFEIALPPDYVLFTPPVEIDLTNDLGELNISIAQSGSTIKAKRSFELYKDVISSEMMGEFKEMIVAWERVDYRKIVIKKR